MLVLHPNTVMEIDGPLGEAVNVAVDGLDGDVLVAVSAGAFVWVGTGVLVITCGVALATPITTGVAVKMDGVCVGGKNGVGPG